LLKEEIRRLERNEQRAPHVANSEYLKNIVVKFATCQAVDQRLALLPVLNTLLRLDDTEMARMRATAMASGGAPMSPTGGDAGGGGSAGWTSYLTRWS
jgi:hypothetical protein